MSKEKSRSYKIVEVTKDDNRLIIDARFYESGKEVGRINHGFPIELSDKEIETEIKKACETLGRRQAREIRHVHERPV